MVVDTLSKTVREFQRCGLKFSLEFVTRLETEEESIRNQKELVTHITGFDICGRASYKTPHDLDTDLGQLNKSIWYAEMAMNMVLDNLERKDKSALLTYLKTHKVQPVLV
jgi:hypothetical protein